MSSFLIIIGCIASFVLVARLHQLHTKVDYENHPSLPCIIEVIAGNEKKYLEGFIWEYSHSPNNRWELITHTTHRISEAMVYDNIEDYTGAIKHLRKNGYQTRWQAFSPNMVEPS